MQTTKTNASALKGAAGLCFVLFGILLLGSVVFYKERMLFTDAPHMLLRIVNAKAVQIEERRIGAYITQIFPLAGVWLGMPLKELIITYSVSFVLIYFIFGLALWKMRQYHYLLLMALYYVLFDSEAFYWTNNEIHQGIPLMFFTFGCLNYLNSRKVHLVLQLIIFIPLAYVAIWTHPLVIIPCTYIWLLERTLKNERATLLRYLLLSAILLVLCYFKYQISANHGYDNSKLEPIGRFGLDNLPGIFRSSQFSTFWYRLVTKYWQAFLLFVAGVALMIREKKWLAILLVCGYALAFISIVSLTFPDAFQVLYYIESEYMIMGIILGAPFILLSGKYLKPRAIILIITLVFGFRLVSIFQSSPVYTERVHYLHTLVGEMRNKGLYKTIIHRNEETEKRLILTWAVPTETMFLSALEGDHPFRTLTIEDTANFNRDLLRKKNIFQDNTLTVSYSKIDLRYFPLDSVRPYQIMR